MDEARGLYIGSAVVNNVWGRESTIANVKSLPLHIKLCMIHYVICMYYWIHYTTYIGHRWGNKFFKKCGEGPLRGRVQTTWTEFWAILTPPPPMYVATFI